MRVRGGRIVRLAVPIRALLQRFAFLLLVAAAAGLLFVGKPDSAFTERLRIVAIDLAVPILSAASEPVVAVNRAIRAVDGLINVYRENDRLRLENARLLQWQDHARRLEDDNAVLRRLLVVLPDMPSATLTARVVGDSGGPFVRTVLLNAGARDGLRKGQAVLSETGVVGRTVEVGQRATRVLLLTDLNSRIPVLVGEARYRAILSGNNSDRPTLDYLPTPVQIAPGDRVVTSGDGGIFPRGLAVGVVASLGQEPRVQPLADLGQLEFVRVLQVEAAAIGRGVTGPGGGGSP